MKLIDYYDDYKNQKKYEKKLNKEIKTASTIEDFYENCLKTNLLKKDDILAWHKMFMEYVDLPETILWARYHENAPKVEGRYDTRRACFTRFNDGFSYTFVSNFDVHEIFNIISKGIVPSAREFLELMRSFQFPLHFDASGACIELDIAAYPNIGRPQFGVLTAGNWYLAHINSVKGAYARSSGTASALAKEEVERIYPRGKAADWKKDTMTGKFIRNLGYSLSQEEKGLVKAHFLRFVDPLNYFLTPGTDYASSDLVLSRKKANIGESETLVEYVRSQYINIYGASAIDEFEKKALVPQAHIFVSGNTTINAKYGVDLKKGAQPKKVKTSKTKPAAKKTITKAPLSTQKIGQYAKNLFEKLIQSGKLSSSQMAELMDKSYCSKVLKMSWPVIVKIDFDFDSQRYYKDIVEKKYRICSQWREGRHRAPLLDWLSKNGF